MKWFFEQILKPWHPTILGVLALVAIANFELPFDEGGRWVSLSSCSKVQPGMTEQEVNAILSLPGQKLEMPRKEPDCEFLMRWRGKHFRFFVFINIKNEVSRIQLIEGPC